MGDIIGDLNSRRGNVGGMNQRGNARAIDAMVPLANMFGYINNPGVHEAKVVLNTACSLITTNKCRRRWPMRSAPKWPNSISGTGDLKGCLRKV